MTNPAWDDIRLDARNHSEFVERAGAPALLMASHRDCITATVPEVSGGDRG